MLSFFFDIYTILFNAQGVVAMMKKFAPVLATLFLFIFLDPVWAGQIQCDSELIPVDNPTIAYKKRKNRCEGFYQSPVSGNLELVSLLYGRLEFDGKKDDMLHIVAPQIAHRRIHIRAVGIPLKTYYRLDAQLHPDESLAWPLDIVKKMNLRSADIGLLGQVVDEPGSYTPLLAKKGKGSPLIPLILVLRSSVDIGKVMWRLGSLKGQQCDQSKADWETIEPAWEDRFFSGEAIELTLPSQQDDFCFEFAAQPIGSAKWLKQAVNIRMKD
ncbi:MAG: hypothetical protein D3923_01850 [Candidatus Electrothrix sp. AR3]|nr:hypothetical protein [Candidatus Electrothrix sp. AR3]